MSSLFGTAERSRRSLGDPLAGRLPCAAPVRGSTAVDRWQVGIRLRKFSRTKGVTSHGFLSWHREVSDAFRPISVRA